MRVTLLAACLLILVPITGSNQATGSNVVMDPRLICKKYTKLRGKLADICRNETALLKEVSKGVALGVSECGFQFKSRRWNCTTVRKSMKKILLKDTRETGFVNAITAAGVTYAITRACTNGDLVQCSCDKSGRKRQNIGVTVVSGPVIPPNFPKIDGYNNPAPVEWQWGGCNDNIRFGFRKSRDFMDARFRKRSDLKTLIKLHNNNAGRIAIKNFMRHECKCHGLSGSCTLRTCWLKMPPFREVGNRLKEKFDGASKVIAGNDGKSFMPEGLTIKPPSKSDLVYTEESPDFCKPNPKTGSLGTEGRECNVTSQGVDGCDLLCCNRGYSSHIVSETENCRCRFKWCCDVTCDVCIGKREVNTCQ